MTRKTTIKKIMSFGLLDRNEAIEALDMMHEFIARTLF